MRRMKQEKYIFTNNQIINEAPFLICVPFFSSVFEDKIHCILNILIQTAKITLC